MFMPNHYEGLDQSTRTMVESMCKGGFLNKSETQAWDFQEELAEKKLTMANH